MKQKAAEFGALLLVFTKWTRKDAKEIAAAGGRAKVERHSRTLFPEPPAHKPHISAESSMSGSSYFAKVANYSGISSLIRSLSSSKSSCWIEPLSSMNA